MLMKATKVCKQKCFFQGFFCPADDPVTLMQKAPGQQPQTESVNHRLELVVTLYKDRLARSLMSKVIYKTVAGIVVKFTSVKHSVGYMTGNLNISRRCQVTTTATKTIY